MKVEIRHLKDLKNPNGELLETVDVNAHVLTPDQILAEVGSALIQYGLETFGEHAQMIKDETIFGSHVRHAITRECIIAL
jgi:hypothetical protein